MKKENLKMANELTDDFSGPSDELVDSARQVATDLAAKTKEIGDTVSETVQGLYDDASDVVKSGVRDAKAIAKKYPLEILAGVAAVGVLTSTFLLRRSHKQGVKHEK